MCGRFQLQLDAPQIASLYPGAVWRPGHATRHTPRDQIRPTTAAPVLIQHHPDLSTHPSPPCPHPTADILMMHWGFSAPTSRQRPSSGSHSGARSLINARSETLLQLPTFRRLLQPHMNARCAVPATGFYEWHKPRGGRTRESQPFLVLRGTRGFVGEGVERGDCAELPVMFMAGLYDPGAGGEAAFVIITAAACAEFAWLHDRQPCFLDSREEVRQWIEGGRFPSGEVVPRLLTSRRGMSWKRMERDLSGECEDQTKPKLQTAITSFFTLKTPQRDGKAGGDGGGSKSAAKGGGVNLGVAPSAQSLKKKRRMRQPKPSGPR